MVDENFARRLAQDLVKIDSSDPGAYEGGIEHFIKRLIEKQLAQLDSPALDAVQIKEFEVLPGRHNLMVTVPGLSDEPRLVYICHMDTVTLGDGWDADTPPLGATVRDDKLYGRGACDMKALKRAADDVTNADTAVGFFTGYTDTAVIAGKTGNNNCMSYSPGLGSRSPTSPTEYVPHADIVRCEQVLVALADNTLWDADSQVGA